MKRLQPNDSNPVPERAYRDVVRFAEQAGVEKLILFGSRARGTFREMSDVDLAVFGGNFDQFYWNVQEKTWGLLRFDLIDLSRPISEELKKEIERDGVIIYEKD